MLENFYNEENEKPIESDTMSYQHKSKRSKHSNLKAVLLLKLMVIHIEINTLILVTVARVIIALERRSTSPMKDFRGVQKY